MVFKQMPRSIKVKRKRYKISYKETLSEKNCDGLCFWDDKKIEIRNQDNILEMESTIIHELLHAIEHEYGLKIREKTIRALEEGLFRVFKDNGWKIIRGK